VSLLSEKHKFKYVPAKFIFKVAQVKLTYRYRAIVIEEPVSQEPS